MLPVTGNVNAMPRKVSCKLVVGSNTITDVKKLAYATDWSGAVTIGQVVSAYITATIPTPTFSLAGANVVHSMGIGTTVEWVQIGNFRIDEESIRTRQGYTMFSAYDKLRYAINTYESALTFPATLQAICNEVCGLIGITSATLPINPTIEENVLDGYTLRDVLGFIAGYCGKNAYLSPSGALQLRWFSAANYTADGTRANIPYIGESDCTIGRLICQTSEGVITAGSGEGIYFTCPFMTQTRLNAMLSGLSLTYRKAEVDIPYGNFCLQSGDIITVSTTGSNLSIPIMSNSWKYDGGLSSAVTSYGVSDYQGNANNAELSVSAQRVRSILAEHKAANRVTQEIVHATEMITGATGGVIKLNFGGNGQTAELLILDTGDVNTAQDVWRMNQGGFGHSGSGYGGPYTTAITADGHVVADVIAGNKISGVQIESTENVTDASQVLISGGALDINRLYNDTVYPIGSVKFIPAAGYYSTDTMALEVEEGKNITIGDTTSPKFIFISDDNSPDMFRFYGVITLYDDLHVETSKDIILEDMYDPNNTGDKSLLNKIEELERRIATLEGRI